MEMEIGFRSNESKIGIEYSDRLARLCVYDDIWSLLTAAGRDVSGSRYQAFNVGDGDDITQRVECDHRIVRVIAPNSGVAMLGSWPHFDPAVR